MKRANLFQTLWIMAATGLLTASRSLRLIIKTYVFGLDRAAFDYATRDWSMRLLKMIKLSYQLHNPYQVDFSKHDHYIIMSNHLSLYDIPLLFLCIPGSLRMIAKIELRKIPLLGKVMEMGEFVFINRQDRSQALKDLEHAKQKLESGIRIWIAPEGTRSRDGKLLPFKKGGFMMAMQMQATIIPVGIRGVGDVLPADSLHVKLAGHADLYVGKPIDTTQYKESERDRLMQDVQAAIIEAAGLE